MKPISQNKIRREFQKNETFYLTICARDKMKLFSKITKIGIIDVPFLRLTEYGKRLNSVIEKYNAENGDVKIHNYVIMPNHVHLLVTLDNKKYNENTKLAAIPNFVAFLKQQTNEKCEINVWQESYNDRLIENEEDFEATWNSIEENPSNWDIDRLLVK